ncbi:MAG TPA: lamin tail domain-containing protein [Kofleriaceae bacterium]|nr:lamin tail domain-containing protein [Kofleriaceae bacterium]
MSLSFLARCFVAAVAVSTLGCHADSGETFTRTLRWHQEPGSEIQDCHVFKLDNADPIEVERITVQFAAGSHHVHIYKSDTPVDDDVSDCWQGIDWTRWHLVLGAQTAPIDWSLPAGRTVPLAPHQQLLVQVHWLNTTNTPIDGSVELAFHTTDHSDAHVGVVFGINKQTAMQPHERKVIRQWCPLPSHTELLGLMGHFHGLGTRYSIDTRPEGAADGSPVYDALDEQTFQFKVFDPPPPVPDGDGLQFECDFFNHTDMPITWGADTKRSEHCNMVAYYYPAEELSTFCIVEAAEVRALEGPKTPVPLDALATYRIVLSEPAGSDGARVRIATIDPMALEVPDTVEIAAGQSEATFTARARRPHRVTVTATLGGTSKTAVTTIGGLVLSEVYTGTAGDTTNQWVEIANLSNAAIDLSTYSLGAGRDDYTAMRKPLDVVVPAKGCVVVNGFSPALGVAGSDASGIALFDNSADQITHTTLPYDALVYGGDNNSLLDPTGDLADVVAAAPASGTYVRTSERWTTQPVGTPGICEVH